MRLAGVTLFAAELGPMIAFYRDGLGFTPNAATRLPDWVEFDTGSARFTLHQIPHDIGGEPSPTPRETASCKPVLAVENLAAARVRLEAAGATILDRPWGGWDFADPEGNVLGVTEFR